MSTNSGNTAPLMNYDEVAEKSYPVFPRDPPNYGDPRKIWIPIVIALLLCNISLFSGFVHVLPENIYGDDVDTQICGINVINCIIRPNHHCCDSEDYNVKYCYFEGAPKECIPLDTTIAYLKSNPGSVKGVFMWSLLFLLGDLLIFIILVVIIVLILFRARATRY